MSRRRTCAVSNVSSGGHESGCPLIRFCKILHKFVLMLLFHLYYKTKPEHLTDGRTDPRKCIVLSPSNWPLLSLLTRELLYVQLTRFRYNSHSHPNIYCNMNEGCSCFIWCMLFPKTFDLLDMNWLIMHDAWEHAQHEWMQFGSKGEWMNLWINEKYVLKRLSAFWNIHTYCRYNWPLTWPCPGVIMVNTG